MGASIQGGGRKRAISEINVTPFVDVMLVLLVIFMITAPMLNQSMDLNLPDVSAATAPQQDQQMVISVRSGGQVFVDQVAVPEDRIHQALAAIIRNRKNEPIFLEADEAVPYGMVAKVIGTIQAAGARKLHLVTEEPQLP